MRPVVFAVTFIFAFGGVLVVGEPDRLPGAGLFAVNSAADGTTVVAAR